MLLEFDKYYHIYNRANGWEKIFLHQDNYRFFLEKYEFHLSAFVDTYCYCLMPNHFHLLIKVKEEKEVLASAANLRGLHRKAKDKKPDLRPFPKLYNDSKLTPSKTLEKVVSKQFSNFFSSYTQAFNKVYGRKGSLFMKNFKRKPITDEHYFRKLVHYIHNNPVKDNLCTRPEEWQYSSYNHILKPTAFNSFVSRNNLLDWFDDISEFIAFHKLTAQLNVSEE
jgi:putative transposase